MAKDRLTLAVQKSGRLADGTLALLRRAGFSLSSSATRKLVVPCRNFPLNVLHFRNQDIPQMVLNRTADIAICGEDLVYERQDDALQVIQKLDFGHCRLVLAAPKPLEIAGCRIATSFPNILSAALKRRGETARIVPLSGSVEIAPQLAIADAICDLVSTGSTLTQNGLQELETLAVFQAVLVTAGGLPEAKQALFERLCVRLRATLDGGAHKYVIMNAPKDALDRIIQLTPGLKNPTISPLADPAWVSIASVVETCHLWPAIDALKAAGATGVLVLPIEQMAP